MYYLFKDDIYGNKIPVMVATKPFADQLVNGMKGLITKVVEIPHSVGSLISTTNGKG